MIRPEYHSKSNYNHAFRTIKGRPFLMIEDLGGVNISSGFAAMSVTNNIENIVAYVCDKNKTNPVEHYIIYKDTDDVWDGFEFSSQQFFSIGEKHWLQAAIKLINI